MGRKHVSRRAVLRSGGAMGLVAVAGCSGQNDDTDATTDEAATESEAATDGEPTAQPEPTESETPAEEEPEEEEESEDESEEPQALGDEWATFQHDVGRSGYAPESTVPTASVEEAWRYELDAYGPPECQPILVDGTVYTAFNDSPDFETPRLGLVAVDAVTGEEEWRQSVTPATPSGSLVTVHSAPVYGGGRIYVETGRGYLVAVDADTGEKQWDREFESVSDGMDGTLLYADGTLYAHAGPTGNTYNENEGGIRALDANTGEEQWAFTNRRSFGALGLADGTLIAKGNSRATTYGLNPDTGARRWESEEYTTRTFACSDGVCYVYGGDASAFTPSGELVWERDDVRFTPTSPEEHGPALANGRMFVRADGIVAVDTETGDELWFVGREEDMPASVTGSPVLGGDGETVFTTASTHALALDAASGEIQWQYELPSGLASDVIVGNNALYLTCDSSDGSVMLALA